MESFEDYGIKIPYRRRNGNIKTVCPNCKTSGRSHPEDKSLSVNLDMGVWNCHYCGWSGGLKGYEGRRLKMRRSYRKPDAIKEGGLEQRAIKYFGDRGISLATLRKMHITEGMEFMPQAGREMNTVQFPYYLDGELVNIKYRTGDKKFKMVQGAELIPYNIDGIKDKETAVVVEGEADCLSFVEAGIDNVVSVPNGANKNLEWLDEFYEGWFDDKSTIYIAVDNDAKGIELRDALVTRFGAERCMLVSWPQGCKDANDVLQKHGREELVRCYKGASDVKVGGVLTAADSKDELDRLYKGEGMQQGMTLGMPNLDPLVSFETKRLMVVTGEPGSGKSEFIDQMCVLLNLRYGAKVAYFSPENMPIAYHDVKVIEKIAGRKFGSATMSLEMYDRTWQYYSQNFFHILPEKDYTLGSILELAKFLVRRHGIKLLVLDPYNRIDMGLSDSEYKFVRDLLRELTNFAQRNDVLLILMAHPKKISRAENSEGIPTLNDISGSKDFWNMADYGLVIHRDREEKTTLVRVSKVKFRWMGSGGDAFFKFNAENGRYVPYYEGQQYVLDNSDYLTSHPQEPVQSNEDFLTQGEDDCPF